MALLRAATSVGKQAVSHRLIGSAHQELGSFNQAAYHFRRALHLDQQAHDQAGAAADGLCLGNTLCSQGDTSQARLVYQVALRAFTRLGSSRGVAQVESRLGSLFAQQRKWEKALASQSRALQGWLQHRDSASAAAALHAIGSVYCQQGAYSRALFYLRGARQMAAATDSLRHSESLMGIGKVYLAVGNYEAALGSFRQAARLAPTVAAAEAPAQLYHLMAAAYDSMGQFEAAEQALHKALVMARHSSSQALLGQEYRALAELYRRTGRYQKSLAALTRVASLQDSVFAQERSAQVAELQTRYETEKKEREIQLLIKDRQIQDATLRRQTLLRNALAAGALLLLIIVGVLYRGRQQQSRINKLLERKNAAISWQKEELGRLNRTKDTLFSIISHDLRSPLSSLYSLLTLLNMGSLPPERLALHSARLTQGLNSTLQLLDNLLNWSAAQIKDDKIRPERLRLDVLAEETLALLLSDAERKNILLQNHLPIPTLVRADVNMVRLILRNLLGNAIKFTPEGGSVTLTAALQGASWSVAVHDTGIGIPAADFSQVLGSNAPFTTLGTAQEKGTGLGLQLCKDFVERNGGQLTFTSRVGQGTTFAFTLPVAAPAAPEPTPALATAAAAAG
ncbi:sensor histidine kinase [Hymenobacter cellulosivorans]|uniref:histidine kinase n=1 Tax=Hymenobacter cellulosivorans TaxID=2932249 RepID=A0ABY4FFP9_9BACT|nr:ATP-binding protein [Hymenobacter cellulosivorans]UOQ55491.1 tetratricopeptide repeat protein [Hymenobacter cellulosivorans]